MVNGNTIDRSFLSLGHPIRREIVERLARGPATVGEATAGFGVSKPAIAKHVRQLEDAGIVRRVRDGRVHWLHLREQPLSDAKRWLRSHRELWERKFDVIAEHLAEESDA